LKDTLTDLELTDDAIQVSDLTEGANNDYTLVKNTSDYTITFTQKYLRSLKTAADLTVTYKAKVTSDAVKAINEETNDVMIEYSHDPHNDTDYDVQKDTTQHYTFSIDASGLGNHSSVEGLKTSEVVKIGVDSAGHPITQKTENSAITTTNTWTGPLEKAVFGLWKNSDSTCEGEPFKTATTGTDGRMTFSGLDAGTYYLKEISAPAGFVVNTDIHTVVLAATTKSVKVTEYYDPADGKWYSTTGEGRKAATYDTDILDTYSVTIDGEEVSEYKFTNENTSNSNEIKWTELDPVELPCQLTNIQGTQLPSTGGIGTTIFYILGGLLVIGAAVILVARRKAQD
jgi:LPXTG-motif cell wall-anchored protein